MSKRIKVLVCDDEVDFRDLMSNWLEFKGYSVITASNGKEAIKIIRENNPDIVFMDLKMPVLDGIAAIKKIRSFNKDLPIIVISAYVDDPKVTEALDYGVSGIFYKDTAFKRAGLPLLESVLRRHKKLKK